MQSGDQQNTVKDLHCGRTETKLSVSARFGRSVALFY